jgi:DNA-binding transcriptional LysR family regulator
MQIESFQMFCDLVETESFTKTAQMNHVTQSAVSQQISSLERVFKSLLVERSKKNFRLTREGEVLYEYGKQILQDYELLHGRIQEFKNIITGSIRVATTYTIGLHRLPFYVKALLKTFPGVNVHVDYRRANDVYADVLGNLADLGLVSYPERNGKLQVLPLWKENLVMVCHPKNPLAKRRSLKLADIMDQKFVAFEPDMPTRKAIDKILRERKVSVKNVMEFDNVETVKRAVEIDAGISILPASTVVQEIGNKSLASSEFQDVDFVRPSAAVYKRNKVLSPAIKQFLALLTKRQGPAIG